MAEGMLVPLRWWQAAKGSTVVRVPIIAMQAIAVVEMSYRLPHGGH
jgi:hypothetical protein